MLDVIVESIDCAMPGQIESEHPIHQATRRRCPRSLGLVYPVPRVFSGQQRVVSAETVKQFSPANI
jgi:CxxC motif-containing protein